MTLPCPPKPNPCGLILRVIRVPYKRVQQRADAKDWWRTLLRGLRATGHRSPNGFTAHYESDTDTVVFRLRYWGEPRPANFRSKT